MASGRHKWVADLSEFSVVFENLGGRLNQVADLSARLVYSSVIITKPGFHDSGFRTGFSDKSRYFSDQRVLEY